MVITLFNPKISFAMGILRACRQTRSLVPTINKRYRVIERAKKGGVA
jgi:hypothetical protein